ncbi:hypothetical protein H8B06_01075 [Sphingobacterium sp. DN00404]|uniref:Uncharacterized protein n=1 Tax=Sphingobacterium micropteri TaxID=2763501 RepID=A0ABR7YJA2_9SPHI|nr:DUF6157 family protein [Sphingobacterium micropteri]MBD1431403.1 hypothetical protein [Sphingobacterium micropteri]
MKAHTTNYKDTFITVADDTKVACGTIPRSKGDKKTIAEMQYELLAENPYKFTSDDILFQVFADRNDLTEAAYEQARKQFFFKGQPCFRASPLTKAYGFGIHCDDQGKMAIYGLETPEYKKFITNKHLKLVKAMKSSK